jgi:6-phospho-3-hexuloisomerase
VAAPTTQGLSAWLTVRDEVSVVLSSLSAHQLHTATAVFGDRWRRWFCAGQGRPGLVAQMTAMRLMHLGFTAHVVGEATAPSIGADDGLLMISGSGETPVSLHLARLAHAFGARLVAVTSSANSALADLADVVVDVSAGDTCQFGGTLFGQSALLLLDAMIYQLADGTPQAYTTMKARHTNLQ